MIEQADLLIALSKDADAERALQDALNAHPTSEALYTVLINFYRDRLDAGDRKYQEPLKVVMRRMLSTIPNSRRARLLVAELRMDAREFDRSEAMLKSLLVEDERDFDAMQMLITLEKISR